LALTVLLPVVLGGGGVVALGTLALGQRMVTRAPTAVRLCVPMLLVVVVTVTVAWRFFAATGTLDGYPGDSGRCPTSNIPPQWPDWIPA
jgi:hypothetical protein